LTIFVLSVIITITLIRNANSQEILKKHEAAFLSQGESRKMNPLITRDPVSGGELIVTRLESPETGIVIKGQFSLGWIGRLTREQLDFVELMVKYRGNIQGVAKEMNIAYNTARSRLDEIVTALGGAPEFDGRVDRRAVLDRLAAKEISVEEAMRLMKG
jgi:hypothetical protein